jgi:serine/threonine protein kinase
MREDGDGVPSEIDPRDAAQFNDVEKPRSAEPSVVHDDDSGQFEREALGDLPAWVGDGKITPKPLERKPEVKTDAETDEDRATAAERSSGMKRGERVGRFVLVKVVAGGKSKDTWIARDPEGSHFFLKLFDEMKYPSKSSPRYEKLAALFDEWESHHRAVFSALRDVNPGDGALVLPRDQGRTDSGLQIFRVYPLVSSTIEDRSDGADIPELAEDLDRAKSRLRSTEDKLRLVRSLCLGLWQLHRRGIVHGDIKPANILVPSSRVGLVARLIDYDNCFFSGLPRSPDLIGGDEKYFSPERMRYGSGDLEDPSELTTKTDIFSLARTLETTLFSSSRGRTRGRFSAEGSVGFPPALSSALEAALSSDPDRRPDAHHLLCASGVFLKKG